MDQLKGKGPKLIDSSAAANSRPRLVDKVPSALWDRRKCRDQDQGGRDGLRT